MGRIATVADLPDEVLLRVFALLDLTERFFLDGVCSKWRALHIAGVPSGCMHLGAVAFNSVQRTTAINDAGLNLGTPDRVSALIKWLRRHSADIRSAEICDWPTQELAEQVFAGLIDGVLCCRSGSVSRLRSLEVYDCALGASAALLRLPRLSGLQALDLQLTGTAESGALGVAIGSLTCLARLVVRMATATKAPAAAVISSDGGGDGRSPCGWDAITGGFPTAICRCTRLQVLRINGAGPTAFTEVPANIAGLPRLRALGMFDCGVSSLARLPPGLLTLDVQCAGSTDVPAPPLRLPPLPATLRRLSVSSAAFPAVLADATGLSFLSANHVRGCEQAQKFLRTFAGLAKVEALDVSGWRDDGSAAIWAESSPEAVAAGDAHA